MKAKPLLLAAFLVLVGKATADPDPNFQMMADLSLQAENGILLAGEVVNADHQGEEAAFNDSLQKLPATLPNSYVISSAGLPGIPDHLHFTSAGLREFGQRYGEKMLAVLRDQATCQK